jgi:ADP-ribosylglycohydrolase
MAATIIRNVKPQLPKYRGALVGAVVGDCLGAYFESMRCVTVEMILNHFASLDTGTKIFHSTYIIALRNF